MKKLIYFLCPLLILGLKPATIKAQIKKGEKIMTVPTDYISPNGPYGYLAQAVDNEVQRDKTKWWIVYCDRENCTTTDYQSGKGKTMKFMDAFIVLEEKSSNRFIHVAKILDPIKFTSSITNLKITNPVSFQDYGWVSEDSMLLWQNAIEDKATKFIVKALAVYQPDALKDPTTAWSKDGIVLYKSPAHNPQLKSDNVIRLFQFEFVYKFEINANNDTIYLIGKSPKFRESSASSDILGWVTSKTIQVWKGRFCLEPNSQADPADERQTKNVRAALYSTREEAEKYKKGDYNGITPPPIWNRDSLSHPPLPNWPRMPVFSNVDGIIHTGVVSDLFNQTNSTVATVDQKDKLEHDLDPGRKEQKNTNIIFVIDGTNAVVTYVNEIINAAEVSNFNNNGDDNNIQDNNFRFGAVIYRTYKDENCSNGDQSLNVILPTTDFNQFKTSLNANTTLGCTTDDDDDGTCLYNGIQSGLKKLETIQNVSKQNNIIVIIGEKGDNKAANKWDALANEAAKDFCAIDAFQVQTSLVGTGCNKFIIQMENLIFQTSKNIQNYVNNNFKSKINEELKMIPSKSGNINSYSLGIKLLPGGAGITYAQAGKSISPNVFSSELNYFINNIDSTNRAFLVKYDNAYNGIGKNPDKEIADPMMKVYLAKQGIDISDQKTAIVIADNNVKQLFISGYTSLTNANLKSDLYNKVILVTEDEYDDLNTAFRNLVDDETDDVLSVQKQKLETAIKELAKAEMGRGESSTSMDKMSIENLMSIYAGLPLQTDVLKVKITDIDNMKKPEFDNLVNFINNRARDLSAVRDNPEYKFSSSDVNFYWIPQNILP